MKVVLPEQAEKEINKIGLCGKKINEVIPQLLSQISLRRYSDIIDYSQKKNWSEEIWGHPLKGLSREKTPPYSKKTYFFWLVIYSVSDSKLNSRLFTNLSTLCRLQLSFVFYPFRARYFFIIGSRSASGGSASVTLRAVGSTSRRPIRFKAIVL